MIEQDDKIRALFRDSNRRTDEKLEYRIMQRITTETLLSKKRSKQSPPPWHLLSAFAAIHAMIALLVTTLYFIVGEDALQNNSIYPAVILITFVCGVFFLITMFDEKRRFKQKKGFN